MYDHTFSELPNHQIRHQATDKVGCQPGDCMWSLYISHGFVWVTILTLLPPRELRLEAILGVGIRIGYTVIFNDNITVYWGKHGSIYVDA